ncbi:hypothetical protein [Pseudomonas koreensis]|uniref:hypothetical protein n=1 Tax=Pseudomonas koreensis TaxID=198620 RepID=UPI0009EE884E|nr:hypothetical protein [Pseudomonas koreensis]
MSVDYETIQKIQKLSDDVLIGVAEVAALTGFSVLTVRQRNDLRQWMRHGPECTSASPVKPVLKTTPENRVGRPTKKEQVEARK